MSGPKLGFIYWRASQFALELFQRSMVIAARGSYVVAALGEPTAPRILALH